MPVRRAAAPVVLVTSLVATTSCALVTHRLPPPASESAARLRPGPHRVLVRDLTVVDGARDRTLPSRIWWPADVRGPAPLLVQVHGFGMNQPGRAARIDFPD